MEETHCPKCNKSITNKDKEFFPFCSKLCREADLYGWLFGEHVISREISEEDWNDPDIAEDVAKLREHIGPLDPYDPRFS